MSWDPNLKSPGVSSVVDTNCTICLEKIVAEDQAPCEGEKPRTLDCSHIFHRECIGSWLVQRHTCPLCRTVVRVDTPEARLPEMSPQEILAVPDHQPVDAEEDVAGILFVIRQNIIGTRRVSHLNLYQNTPVAANARQVNSFALSFFNRFQ